MIFQYKNDDYGEHVDHKEFERLVPLLGEDGETDGAASKKPVTPFPQGGDVIGNHSMLL